MNKIECDIIKDLIPNYVENLVSDKTRQAVDEHIKTCKTCKEDLEMLKEEKARQEKEEREKQEEIEINHLKKYSKRLFISKIIASSLLVVILITWGIFLIMNISYKEELNHGKYVCGLIQEAGKKLEELENENNLEIIEEKIMIGREGEEDKDTQTWIFKYKDEKSSQRYIGTLKNGQSVVMSNVYGITIENEAYGGKVVKEVEISGGEYQRTTAIYRNPYTRAPYMSFIHYDEYDCSKFELREEEYNGKSCYVIRRRNRRILSRDLDR